MMMCLQNLLSHIDSKHPIPTQTTSNWAGTGPSNGQALGDLNGMTDPDDPNGNWYEHTGTFRVAAIYCFTIFLAYSLLTIVVASQGTFNNLDRSSLIAEFQYIWMYLILAFTGTYGVILFSLMIESLWSKKFRIMRIVLQSINWMVFFLVSFSISVDPRFPSVTNVWRLCAQPLTYAVYALFAICCRVCC